VYTDNAKVYRSQQFEYICASLGCTLLHSQPFSPKGRGKVERLFRTVRMRFLSGIGKDFSGGIEELNQRYNQWLASDYLHKTHSSLNGLSPHGALMSQVERLRLPSDQRAVNEAFMLRASRKIGADATTQLDNVLYETDAVFAGKRLELRYEPEWVGNEGKTLLLYHEGKAVGEARMVRFHDNAHAKRRKAVKQHTDYLPRNTISFQQAMNMSAKGDSHV
jgi:transposase InsO family protein